MKDKCKSVISREEAMKEVIEATPIACEEINHFSQKVFLTRGGRMGSGMGVLLEALWAYYVIQGRPTREIGNEKWEIGWLPDNEYNDFACLRCNTTWNPDTKHGELFRIEAKSMNCDADESKGHFDELVDNLGRFDLLLVLVWAWEPSDRERVFPRIRDHFICPARPIAMLRDQLHLARGGSFVDRATCSDGCNPAACPHHGEPLNANGKRERLSGPVSLRPSAKVSFAANFGGLLRMLKTASPEARDVFQKARADSETAHRYISFIHRNFPKEEENQYLTADWKAVAGESQISTNGLSRQEIIAIVRQQPDYMEMLRQLK
jgi:hypothetical protein